LHFINQNENQEEHPDIYEKIQNIISTLQSYIEDNVPFTFVVDDPAGNSYVENLYGN